MKEDLQRWFPVLIVAALMLPPLALYPKAAPAIFALMGAAPLLMGLAALKCLINAKWVYRLYLQNVQLSSSGARINTFVRNQVAGERRDGAFRVAPPKNPRLRLATLLGLAVGLISAWCVLVSVTRHPEWSRVVAADVRAARWWWILLAAEDPLLGALLARSAVVWLELKGWLMSPIGLAVRKDGRPGDGKLPPYPFDPTKTQLILGEVHRQDGKRSLTPDWVVLPEKGMCTGVLVTGATGSAKTSAAQYPFTAQLIRLNARDEEKKLGGLIIDAKGNYADYVRDQCVQAGRLDDYYEVSLKSGVRYNILARPDLAPQALASHITDMMANYQGGKSPEPFWTEAAKELNAAIIRIVRLGAGREPTMQDFYRLASSEQEFQSWLKMCADRCEGGQASAEDQAEYEALKFWLTSSMAGKDPKLKGSIAAMVITMAAMFEEPEIRHAFCPLDDEANFLGFDELIRRGAIVALKVPYSQLKGVSLIVQTATKLNFFDRVLTRLAAAEKEGPNKDPGRVCFFVADEYDTIVSHPADATFLSKCREAKCCSVIATQSYESLKAKLEHDSRMAVLLANLRTKIWLCAEDVTTAEGASKLCGEIEREKVTLTQNEQNLAAYSLLDRNFISAEHGQLSVGTNVTPQREALFPPRAFTTLALNQAIAKVFDGTMVREPTYLYLKPYYEDPNISWFDSVAGRLWSEAQALSATQPDGSRLQGPVGAVA